MVSSKEKYFFIINTSAGKSSSNDVQGIVNEIDRVLSAKNASYDYFFTRYAGDATEKAKIIAKNNEYPVIISVGGDGTFNEILNGVMLSNNPNAVLGIIPTGSGNDYFRILSDDKSDIFHRTVSGTTLDMDVIKINDFYCGNIFSIGFDASVAQKISSIKKISYIPNNLVYPISIFYSLFSFENPRIKLSFEGRSLKDNSHVNFDYERDITLLAIGIKGKYYGNGIPILPTTSINNGLLNVCLADKINKRAIPYLINKNVKGETHGSLPFVHMYETDYIEIKSDIPIPCNFDGETSELNDISIGIEKGKARILKP